MPPPDRPSLSQEDFNIIDDLFQGHVRASAQAMVSMATAIDSLKEAVSGVTAEAINSAEQTVSSALAEAVASMEKTVADAVAKSSRRSSASANLSLTVAILALFSGLAFWALDARLSAYEHTQEKRLDAYEKSMIDFAENLKILRQEDSERTNAFYDQISNVANRVDAVTGHVNSVYDMMLSKILPALGGGSDGDEDKFPAVPEFQE